MKIVCIGDSLTHGYKIEDKIKWTTLLQEYLKIKVENKGIIGDTTSGMISRFGRDVLDEKPTHVIIMGGVNDLVWDIPLSILYSNLSSMIYQAYFHKIIPILGIPIPVISLKAKENFKYNVDFEELNIKLKILRNWVIDFSKLSQCFLVNLYDVFDCISLHDEKNKLYLDGVHPSIEGNRLIADYIYNIFVKNII